VPIMAFAWIPILAGPWLMPGRANGYATLKFLKPSYQRGERQSS